MDLNPALIAPAPVRGRQRGSTVRRPGNVPAADWAPARATCGTCFRSYPTTTGACHCGRCHNTFCDVELFDAHLCEDGCIQVRATAHVEFVKGIWTWKQ